MLTPARNAPSAAPGLTDRYRGVLDFLRRYDGGGCFVVLPSVRGGLLGLDGFTGEDTRPVAFAEEFGRTTGVAADTRLDAVSAAQCRALSFARNLPAYPAFSLRFEIARRQLRSGERLEGTIRNVDGRTLHLLLVDDEGKVQNAGGFARRVGADATFAAHMTLTGGPVETVQLVVALATEAPLETVTRLSGEQTGSFFAELAEEIAARHLSPDLAIAAFSVR